MFEFFAQIVGFGVFFKGASGNIHFMESDIIWVFLLIK